MKYDETSPYYRELLSGIRDQQTGRDVLYHDEKTQKLVLDLHDKTNYTIMLSHLQLLMRLGVQVLRVHQVVEYEQERWMQGYIQKNTGHA